MVQRATSWTVWMAAAWGMAAGCGHAQAPAAAIPAMRPTAAAQTQTQTQTINMPATTKAYAQSVAAGRRARVTWLGGVLTIEADNSSLNGILREVSRQTGMTVTGGVADERVFGSYGPGAPGAVLEALLQGTGSNMLLRENAAQEPMELVLSARQGGPTPPGPAMSAKEDQEDDLPPERIAPSSRPSRFAAIPPGASGGTVSTLGAGAPGAATPAGSAAAGTTDQQSPNGVKTPQQIYDQLIQMQQQQKAGTATQPAATPPQ